MKIDIEKYNPYWIIQYKHIKDQLSSILNRVNKSSYFYKKIIHKAKKDIFEHYSIDNMVSKIYDMIIT